MTRVASVLVRISLLAFGPVVLAGAARALPAQDVALEGTIALEVVDAAGEPVVGVLVRLEPLPRELGDGPDVRRLPDPVVTNESGLAWVGVPPGEDRFLLIFDNRERLAFPERVRVPAMASGEGRERTVVFSTRIDATFRGRVVDDVGVPIVNAKIIVEEPGRRRGGDLVISRSLEATTTSTSNGTFEVRVAAWKPTTLRIHASGHAPRRVDVGRSGRAVDTDTPVDLALVRGATLEVRAFGREGRKRVELTAYSSCLAPDVPFMMQFMDGRRIRFVAEERDGLFVFEDLPAGQTMQLDAEATGGMTRRIDGVCTPEPGAVRRIDIDLMPDRRLSGRVVDSKGRPIEGATIWLADDGDYRRGAFRAGNRKRGIATTDADGRFVSIGMVAGVYRVGLAPPKAHGHLPEYAAATSIVDATRGDPDPIEVVVHSGLTIRGSVVGVDGEPCARTVSCYSRETGHSVYGSKSTADGTFELGPLLPGAYRVRSDSQGSTTGSEPIVVDAGSEGVELRVRKAGTIATRVVDGVSGAQRRAAVSFSGIDSDSFRGTSSSTDARTTMGGLEPGRYVVSARAEDGLVGTSGVVRVVGGEETDCGEIRLFPGTRLRVLCPNLRGNMSLRVRCADGFRVVDNIAAPGHLDLFVPPGEVTISLGRPGRDRTIVRTVEAVPGRLTRCVIEEGAEGGTEERR